MKKFLVIFIALLAMLALVSCGDGGNTGDGSNNTPGAVDNGQYYDASYGSNFETTHKAVIEIENYGVIKLDLYGKEAPVTVVNFANLANSGFYNGLTFHRIIEGFMMQGGCPSGNGTGSSGTNIIGEFSNNGSNNKISHKAGVISMARSGHSVYDYYYYDTASCQFFIVHEDSAFLDGNYAGFGMVTEGMNVVNAICTTAKTTDSNGSVDRANQPVIKSISVECVSEDFKVKAPVASHEAVIEIQNYGTITLELYENIAPITVANFEKLANEGFYNGLTLHRIMKDFMMQGGCPSGDGTGDSGTDIKGEFLANGVYNPLSHKRGVISMARSKEYNSASSQFFIMQDDAPHLDYNYAAFGMVTSGLDIVDRICNEAQPTDNNGSIAKADQPIITSITVTKK